MTGRKRIEDATKLFATVDPLTGAYNRRQGDALLAAEFSRYDRDGQSFAALMLDVDHFKSINDRFGHPAGDAVLRTLVQTAQNALRTSDVVARWGREEFLLVLPGADAAAACPGPSGYAPRSRIRKLPVSTGVAVPTSNDPKELLRRSDVALYAAKTGSRTG